VTSNQGVDGKGTGRHGIDWLARLGLVARGLVYLLVGWLALQIAFGDSGTQADRQGALHQIAGQPGGTVLLVAVAVGFAGYAIWRATEAIWGHRDADGGERALKRLASAGRALLYGGFTVSTVKVIVGASSEGSDATSRKAASGLLGEPFGRELVIAGGVGFVIAGIVLAVRGLMRTFEDNLKTAQMSESMRHAVQAVGIAGQTARGVIFAIVGWFLIDAAVSYDPHKARGLDGSLRTLAQAGWGKAALVAVALGLAAFGLYSLAEARYRRT
jgi:hypothetical protein